MDSKNHYSKKSRIVPPREQNKWVRFSFISGLFKMITNIKIYKEICKKRNKQKDSFMIFQICLVRMLYWKIYSEILVSREFWRRIFAYLFWYSQRYCSPDKGYIYIYILYVYTYIYIYINIYIYVYIYHNYEKQSMSRDIFKTFETTKSNYKEDPLQKTLKG